ncbi:MAG: hypothetical protein ACE5E7_01010 [Anaerolineae bacterium]
MLAAHADALNAGADGEAFDSAAWVARNYPSEAGRFLSLLLLAHAIKRVLAPVAPPLLFKSELRHRLENYAPTVEVELRPARRMVWLGAAVIGSALSLAGLILWLLRRVRLGQGKTRPLTTAV